MSLYRLVQLSLRFALISLVSVLTGIFALGVVEAVVFSRKIFISLANTLSPSTYTVCVVDSIKNCGG